MLFHTHGVSGKFLFISNVLYETGNVSQHHGYMKVFFKLKSKAARKHSSITGIDIYYIIYTKIEMW